MTSKAWLYLILILLVLGAWWLGGAFLGVIVFLVALVIAGWDWLMSLFDPPKGQ